MKQKIEEGDERKSRSPHDWLKRAVSRNSAKLGNYKIPVKSRET